MRNTFFGTMAALAITALLTPSAQAKSVSYNAVLTASKEVPPNTGKGSGRLSAVYDTVSKQLKWTLNYKRLTGPETAAHFHGPAETGKNADVVIPLPGTTSPLTGTATLTDAQAADLAAGKWYVNVHTAANKDGEIRGQVVKGK